MTDNDQLVQLIEAKAKSGVFLSVLGFGMGNIKDDKLEKLADKGNGHYAYIDSPREAYKVLVEEMGANLITVAKDVKIQVDFNRRQGVGLPPDRLRGPRDGQRGLRQRCQGCRRDRRRPPCHGALRARAAGWSGEEPRCGRGAEHRARVVHPELRYKKPDQDKSRLIEQKAVDSGTDFAQASDDLKFATAVAGFGMLFRDSPHKGTLTYAGLLEIAQPALDEDPSGYRKEFVDLVRKAQALAAQGIGAVPVAP